MQTLTIGEAPPFELQICRTSGDYRYRCNCRHCKRAYRRRLNQLIAESQQAVALLTVLEEESPAVLTHSLTCPQTELSRGICECASCMATKQRILAAIEDTENLLLHSLSSCAFMASDAATGQVPGFPQSLADSLESAEVGRFVCGGKGVG